MPNFDVNTTTPGSAVADTLQMILQRRKEEARQMMLDKLGIEKFRSDENDRSAQRANQEAQLGLERRRTEAQVAANNEARIASKLGTLGHGEQDIDSIRDEELREVLRQRGLTAQRPGASVTTSTELDAEPGTSDHFAPSAPETTSTPGREVYVGSQKFQEEQDAIRRMAEFRNSTDFNSDNPLAVLTGGAMAGLNVPQGALPSKTRVLSPGGALRNTLTGRMGDNVLELNHPPNPPAATQPYPFQVPNAEGVMETHWLTPGQQPSAQTRINAPGPVQRGNMPATRQQNVVDVRLLNTLTSVIRDTRMPRDQRAAAVDQAKTALLAGAQTTPEVKQWIGMFIDHVNDATSAGQPLPSVEQSIQAAEADIEGLTEIERAHLISLIPLFITQ